MTLPSHQCCCSHCAGFAAQGEEDARHVRSSVEPLCGQSSKALTAYCLCLSPWALHRDKSGMTALAVLPRCCPEKYCCGSSLQKRKEKQKPALFLRTYLRMGFNCLLGNGGKVIKVNKELSEKSSQRIYCGMLTANTCWSPVKSLSRDSISKWALSIQLMHFPPLLEF